MELANRYPPATPYMSVNLEFVDTNVLLYAYDHTEPEKQAKAEALLRHKPVTPLTEGAIWVQGSARPGAFAAAAAH